LEYVVCYDLSDDRRRERMARVLLDYGRRVQESVFVMDLDEELYERMMMRVRREADESWDWVHIFPLCKSCVGKVVVIGRAEMPKDPDFVIV
jgi:CRISPR-associated protein Cas2